MTTKTPEEPVAIHNLFTREIRPIRNWNEWLERWQAAVALEEMLGLLHAGFNVRFDQYEHYEKKYGLEDRLVFYFGIADGWAERYLLETSKDGRVEYEVGRDEHGNMQRKSPSGLRQMLAEKAFDMLCLNFFRPELHVELEDRKCVGYNSYWARSVANERLFPVILNFFRAEAKEGRFGGSIRIRNLSGHDEQSHNEKQAVVFLISLAVFIWKWKEEDTRYFTDSNKDEAEKHNVTTRARLEVAKPWMIEVLAQLGKLDVLRKWMLRQSEACLAKLREIALRNELDDSCHPVKKDRRVTTLDEACYVGSTAAWFLERHKLMMREHKRLTAILEAERKKEAAEQELQELTPKV